MGNSVDIKRNSDNANVVEETNGFTTANLFQITAKLKEKAWLIILVGLLCAALSYGYSFFFVTPLYSSNVLLYINSNDVSETPSTSVSPSELTASKSLVQTYIIILKNRTTINAVIDDLNIKGLSYAKVINMIDASSVNDTEVLSVRVTSDDPILSAKIANSIAKVLPKRGNELVDGSSVRVVDKATVNLKQVSPSYFNNSAVGFFVGCFAVIVILTLITIFSKKIPDAEFFTENFNLPILAQIPDIDIQEGNNSRSKHKEKFDGFVFGYYKSDRINEKTKISIQSDDVN